MNGRAWFAISLAAFATALLAAGWGWYRYSFEVFLLPLLAGSSLIGLAIPIALGERIRKNANEYELQEGAMGELGRLAFGATILPAIVLLGFSAGAAVFLAIALSKAGVGLRAAIVAGVASVVVTELVLGRILEIPLPSPMLFP
ncbi:MAG: hypothetical protein DWQ08_11245 [Proteobacteria bacterium]|nr:MAG: hypothetical protein DWQ08_11245 [Pseudomonadota bacterium]